MPWSYSALTAFETCPWRYYLTRISKAVSEQQTPATIEGNKLHKAFEYAVGGKTALPPEYTQHVPLVSKLRAAPGQRHTELKIALTSGLKPTGYWDDNVWVRCVIDLAIVRQKTGTLLDYKTGKRKLDSDQLKLFAVAGFANWPYLQKITTGYLWLKENKLDPEVFTPDDVPAIARTFAERVFMMEQAQKNDEWPKHKSGLCREWCPVGRGNCEHCGA